MWRCMDTGIGLLTLVDVLDAAAAAIAHQAPARSLPPELRERVLSEVRSGKTVSFPLRSRWIPWAIAAGLANNLPLEGAVRRAKKFVTAAIAQHFAWDAIQALNQSPQ